MKCLKCEKGNLYKGNVKEYLYGVYLGEFEELICDKCQETFTSSEVTQKIQDAAKAKGIWGLGSVSKVTKTGNSLAVRIPKKIADYLKLKSGKEVFVHPEDGKIVVEIKV